MPLKTLSLCLDLDGTIIDTAPDLVGTLNDVLLEFSFDKTDYDLAKRAVGYGSRALITGAFERSGQSVDPSQIDDMQARFLESYAQRLTRLSKPFPGVVRTLKDLSQQGVDISICTNKPGYLARPLIEELGLTPLFSRIVGSDDVKRKKPDAAHIFSSAGHRGHKGWIVMVGDSLPDVLSARNAGVPSIVMAYGYSTIPAIKLGADYILRNFRDIPSTLSKIAPKRD